MMHTRLFLKMAIAILIASLPATALAQNSISLTQPSGLSNVGASTATINLEDCEDNVGKSLNFEVTFDTLDAGKGYTLYRVPDGGTCPVKFEDSPSGECETLEVDMNVPEAGSYNYDDKTLAEFVDNVGCSDLSGTSYVFRVVVEAPTDPAGASFNYTLTFSTEAPDNIVTEAPTLDAGQSTMTVSFPGNPGEGSFQIYYARSAPGEITRGAEWEAAGAETVANVTSPKKVDGLTTNATYWVAITTFSSDGNESDLSPAAQVVTMPTADFFELYAEAGGEDGCESSQAGTPRGTFLWILALLGGLFLAARTRKRTTVTALVALSVLAVPVVSQAQSKSWDDSKGLVEARVGSYIPEIDTAVDGSPYKTAFGESMLLFELELDRQFWRGVGTLGFNFNVGYASVEGRSQTTGEDSGDSPDKTSLSIMPLRAGLVYRFDYLAHRFDIPFTLALKGGVDMYTWWVQAGDNLATANGKTGDGVTFGYHYAAGLHLLLDWFDEHSADGLALDFGVINTYLFAEVQRAEVDGFGDDKSIRLSDTHYSFGLAFEY
jgi:hypothetical protein